MASTEAPATEQTQDNGNGTPTPTEALLNGTRTQLEAQLEELRAAHEEFMRVQTILSNFDAIASGQAIRSRGTTATADRAARGERPEQFLAIVKESGDKGITVAEVADKMGMENANYLYRLAKDMVAANKLRKDDEKRFYAV